MQKQEIRESVGSALRKARLRQLSVWETVQEIHQTCGVGLLRAHRLAHGWTLKQVVAMIREQGGTEAGTLTHQRLSRWETHGEVPSARYLTQLCRLYETRPDRLGFGQDFEPVGVPPPLVVVARDLSLPPAGGTALSRFDLAGLQEVRGRLRDLVDPTASGRQLVDWWEGRATFYNTCYRRIPHEEYLAHAVRDFRRVVGAMERRHPLALLRRLHHATAVVAGCVGVVCVDLARADDSYAWFRIGEAAAAQTGDRQLQAWIRTRHALAELYYGSAEEAAKAARAASEISGRNSSVAAVMAPAVEARALARLGRNRAAEDALKKSVDAFSIFSGSSQDNSGLISVPAHKVRFYEGNVLARTGRRSAALAAQQDALLHYPGNDRVDPALIHIDRAIALVGGGYVLDALAEVENTLADLSASDRGGTVAAHARELTKLVPSSYRRRDVYRRLVALIDGTDRT